MLPYTRGEVGGVELGLDASVFGQELREYEDLGLEMNIVKDVPLSIDMLLSKTTVLGFLDWRDIIALRGTCAGMRNHWSLKVSELTWDGMERDGDWSGPFHCTDLLWQKLPFDNSVHTYVIVFMARDQGWGNIKGRLMVKDSEEARNLSDMKKCAQHGWERFVMTLRPNQVEALPQEGLGLFHHVGGGGGHQLFIRHLHVLACGRTLVETK